MLGSRLVINAAGLAWSYKIELKTLDHLFNYMQKRMATYIKTVLIPCRDAKNKQLFITIEYCSGHCYCCFI